MKKTQQTGFSLIEVVVAITIIIAISAVGMGVLVSAQNAAKGARVRAQMDRDTAVVMGTLQHDLSYFGAGVAVGTDGDGILPPLVPVLRLGRADELVFQGDLPYPNSEFNGVVQVVNLDKGLLGSGSDAIAAMSEISGPCTPWNNAAAAPQRCRTTKTTLIPATYVAADDCNESQPNARTCPWSMNKWFQPSASVALGGSTPGNVDVAPNHLFWTFVDPGGNWYSRVNADNLIGFDDAFTPPSTTDNYWGFSFDDNYPPAGSNFNTELAANVGGAFISTLDRVFFVVEDENNPGTTCTPTAAGTPGNCALRRVQCWGSPSPSNADFPPASATAYYPSTNTPVNCKSSIMQGTMTAAGQAGWETLATGVKNISFSYFDAAGPSPLTGGGVDAANCNPVTIPANCAKSRVRAIEVTIDMERKVPGAGQLTVTSSMTRRFFLPSREVF